MSHSGFGYELTFQGMAGTMRFYKSGVDGGTANFAN